LGVSQPRTFYSSTTAQQGSVSGVALGDFCLEDCDLLAMAPKPRQTVLILEHSIADHQQLPHTHSQSHHNGIALVTQLLVIHFDEGLHCIKVPLHR
jgi:hypothetical protein